MLADVPHMKSTCQNVLFDVQPHNPTAQSIYCITGKLN